jgi:ParB family chromosome partitioning protein
MVKKRGLGKSLDALLAYTGADLHAVASAEEPTAQEKISLLRIEQIQRGKYQPRREMDTAALEELANSIRAQGILQPLIVRSIGNDYEIVAGERRWRAAQLAGLTEVPAIIRAIPDEAAIAIALIENIQRQNLNAIEEAFALQRLSEEFELTHQQVAEAVGKSRASVTNLLRLLALPDEVKNMLDRKLLEMGHARSLLTLPFALQVEAAELIVAKGLSVRDTEHLVRRLQSPAIKQNSPVLDPDIQHIQDRLSHQLKLRVAIQCNAKGKGKLVIHYRSLAELDSLLSQFQD